MLVRSTLPGVYRLCNLVPPGGRTTVLAPEKLAGLWHSVPWIDQVITFAGRRLSAAERRQVRAAEAGVSGVLPKSFGAAGPKGGRAGKGGESGVSLVRGGRAGEAAGGGGRGRTWVDVGGRGWSARPMCGTVVESGAQMCSRWLPAAPGQLPAAPGSSRQLRAATGSSL